MSLSASRYRRLLVVASMLLIAGCATPPPIKQTVAPAKPKIGLALGGGAARGFAHIGVIKMLESQGIIADYVVGTSAGAVVGAL
jgi:NTE family protein